MSCKCFENEELRPSQSLSFEQRLAKSKCMCTARFVVKEKKSKFSISNDVSLDQIDKYKIDNFFDSSKVQPKCDYLFTYKENKIDITTFIFVELKGCDIKHAYYQLHNTIENFYKEGLLRDKKIRAALVYSHYPKDNGTARKLKKQIWASLSSKLDNWNGIEEMSTRMTYFPVKDKFTQ